MKASNIQDALAACIETKQPVFIWGAPGVGKSDSVRQVADRLFNMGQPNTGTRPYLRDVRAVLLDPVDFRGLPVIRDGRAAWVTPDFLPTDGKGILFLDELNAAPPLVQAAGYQLVLDRRLGDYILPEGWTVIAAGNRETDRAVTSRMPSPLKNRFIHLGFDVDLEDWIAWALNAGIKTEVIAFLRFRPNLLHSFDPTRTDNAFPTPRSWEFVSRLVTKGLPGAIEFDVLAGTVGDGAAAEFLAFLKIFRSLPNPDSVLLQPDKAIVPTDPATLYAICGALARKSSDQNMGRLVTYANRLPAEFSVLLIRDSVKHCPDVCNTRAFIEWSSKHSDVLI